MRIGDYEVLGTLGRGGGGVVYRVRATDGRELALKLLGEEATPERQSRFDRERRLLQELGESRGFVPLLEAGRAPQGAFVVMPLVPGGTLRARLERGPLAVDETVALGRTLARALGEANERGVVHRDVKPENVLFTGDGKPLVADLGIARHFTPESDPKARSVALTRTGALLGTAGYVAPEQLEAARDVGPAADVFALGVVLYECLVGTPPFVAEHPLALIDEILSGSRTPLAEARPEVPPRLAAVVERALAHDPKDRFANGAALAAALDASTGRGRPVRLLAAAGVLALAALVALAVLLRPTSTKAPARDTRFLEADIAFERSAWAEAASRYDRARSQLDSDALMPELAQKRQAAAHVLAGEPWGKLLAPFSTKELEEPPLSLACAWLYERVLVARDTEAALHELDRVPIPVASRMTVARAWLKVAGTKAVELKSTIRSSPGFDGVAAATKPMIDALARATELDPTIGFYPEAVAPGLQAFWDATWRLTMTADPQAEPFEPRPSAPLRSALLSAFEHLPRHPLGLWVREGHAFLTRNTAERERVFEEFLAEAKELHPVPLEMRWLARDIATLRPDIASPDGAWGLGYLRRFAEVADDRDAWSTLANAYSLVPDKAAALEARKKAESADSLPRLFAERARGRPK